MGDLQIDYRFVIRCCAR